MRYGSQPYGIPEIGPGKSWIFIISSITIAQKNQLKLVKANLGQCRRWSALEMPNDTSKITIKSGMESLSVTDLLAAFSRAYSQLISIPRIVKNVMIYLWFST